LGGDFRIASQKLEKDFRILLSRLPDSEIRI